jgi:GTP 3',8-cyclase
MESKKTTTSSETKMTCKALFIDFDGTMVDTESILFESWRAVYRTFGIELDIKLWAKDIRPERPHAAAYSLLCSLVRHPPSQEETMMLQKKIENIQIAESTLRQGIKELLVVCNTRLDIPITIVTSSATSRIAPILNFLGILSLVKYIVSSDRVQAKKPDPSCFRYALENGRYKPEEVFVIEDSPVGIAAAKKVGITTMVFPNPVTELMDLTEADITINSGLDALAYIESRNQSCHLTKSHKNKIPFEQSSCLQDRFGRSIKYLRVSLTQQCNFHCNYCCPDCIETKNEKNKIMEASDTLRIIEAAGKIGFDKIRLTGGEPLMRNDIVELVGEIRRYGYFRTIAMTTNGSLLTAELAANLYSAGLTHITVSLNTLDRDEFRQMTGVDAFDRVINGITSACKIPFKKIKINMVVSEHTSKDKIGLMRDFCSHKGLTLQTISEFSIIDRTVSAHTAVTTDRPSSCRVCNRIRLTARGVLRPCLFDDTEVKTDLNNIEKSLRKAVFMKPEKGGICTRETMKEIGG